MSSNMGMTVEYEWREMLGSGVSPAIRCNSASFVYNGSMWLIFGSGAGIGKSAEVWRFNLKTCKWTLEVCGGEIPEGREGHSANYLGNGKVIVFGGQGVPYSNQGKSDKITETLKVKTYFVRDVFNNLYEFDCDTLRWRSLTIEGASIPLGRRGHISCICNISSKYLVSDERRGPPSPQTRHGSKRQASKQQSHSHSTVETMEKVFFVFGGAGVEPSKYTEVLYNDCWAYCFSRERWYRLNPKGANPRPTCSHKAELIGEHTLVVVGGMIGMEPHYRHLAYDAQSDIMILNTHSMQWSYLNIMYPNMRPAKLSFHGHSIAAKWQDGSNTNGMLFLFGGKDVPDIKGGTVQAYDTMYHRSSSSHGQKPFSWAIDLQSGIVTPLETVGSLVPENRYGHIGVAAYSSELQAHDPPKAVETPAAGGKPQHLGVMGRFKASQNREFENFEEPILYIYGGCYVSTGGFCGHTVYQLLRIQRYFSIEEDVARTPLQSSKSTKYRAKSIKADKSLQGMYFSEKISVDDSMLSIASGDSTSSKMTMWERRAFQIRQDQLNFGAQCEQIQPMQQPKNWKELKFAISYPLHEREGGDIPDSLSTHSKSSKQLSPTNSTIHSPYDDEKKASNQLDAETRRQLRIKSMSDALLPLLKDKSIHQAKKEYLKRYPPSFVRDELIISNGPSSPLTRSMHLNG